MCLEVANTGQAVIIDAGEAKDIHPRNKWIVGNRLAVWALAHTFNKKDVDCASPIAANANFADGKVTVDFDFVGSGLVVGKLNDREFSAIDGKLARFAVAGKDGKFVWADAQIVGKNQVVVSAESVAEPTAVRYAWQMNPDGANVYTADGLPATPFAIVK